MPEKWVFNDKNKKEKAKEVRKAGFKNPLKKYVPWTKIDEGYSIGTKYLNDEELAILYGNMLKQKRKKKRKGRKRKPKHLVNVEESDNLPDLGDILNDSNEESGDSDDDQDEELDPDDLLDFF
ncbi:MAG: hypothetical protein GF317_05950 [Candidatus Lokiarchaeota archaeon]|nr:hypothetical protein [Candidatus Lokiarchaeota archaeon]